MALQELNLDDVTALLGPMIDPTPGQSDLNYGFDVPQPSTSKHVQRTDVSNLGLMPVPQDQHYICQMKYDLHATLTAFRNKEVKFVSTFPQKEKLKGCNFSVAFPKGNSKIILTVDKNEMKLNTVRDYPLAVFFTHNAGSSAKIRLLVVYADDSHSSKPVNPCLNHHDPMRKQHFLLVSEVSSSVWEFVPHPSILVTPCEANPNPSMKLIPKMNSNLPAYCANVKFICLNSCKTRKNLSFICQLEDSNIILARECILLKVSHSPRRDSKSKVSRTIAGNRLRGKSPKLSGALVKILKDYDDENIKLMLTTKDSKVKIRKIVQQAKKAATDSAMMFAFKNLFPEQYEREIALFNGIWDAIITPQQLLTTT